jgi:hypothetical protein
MYVFVCARTYSWYKVVQIEAHGMDVYLCICMYICVYVYLCVSMNEEQQKEAHRVDVYMCICMCVCVSVYEHPPIM